MSCELAKLKVGVIQGVYRTYYNIFLCEKFVQESACLHLYHKAMKQQQDGKFREAKQLYQEILDSEVMVEVGRDSGRHGGVEGEATIARDSTITRLKYLIYKNLASIAKEQGDYSAAVDAYIEVWIN